MLIAKRNWQTPTEIESDKNNISSASPVNVINSDVCRIYSKCWYLSKNKESFSLVRNKTLWLNDEYRTSDFIGDAEDVLW
jgi:hypothetical protein